jgi:hypothetical protein
MQFNAGYSHIPTLPSPTGLFHYSNSAVLYEVRNDRIIHSFYSSYDYTGQQSFWPMRKKCLFLKYFWTLNSNIYPEFLYQPHISLSDSESSDEAVGQAKNNMDCDPTFAGTCSSIEPHLLTQEDLQDIARDLNLSKDQAELLGPG